MAGLCMCSSVSECTCKFGNDLGEMNYASGWYALMQVYANICLLFVLFFTFTKVRSSLLLYVQYGIKVESESVVLLVRPTCLFSL